MSNWTRAALYAAADEYLAALVAHDVGRLKLAPGVVFTENNVQIRLGDGDDSATGGSISRRRSSSRPVPRRRRPVADDTEVTREPGVSHRPRPSLVPFGGASPTEGTADLGNSPVPEPKQMPHRQPRPFGLVEDHRRQPGVPRNVGHHHGERAFKG